METTDHKIAAAVAAACSLPLKGVEATIRLLDEGATVPFISRYRKEATGSLDEVAVRAVETAVKAQRELEARREFVRTQIEAAGALTAQLARRLDEAADMTAVDDIYAPFKPRKRTRATIAREKGLEPLARMIMAGNMTDCRAGARRFTGPDRAASADEALAGASDIIAEWASESQRLRNITRNTYRRTASIEAAPVKGKEAELAASPFAQYAQFAQGMRRIASHQYLALRRAEAEGLLKVRFALPDREGLDRALCEAFVPTKAAPESAAIIAGAVTDASGRLLRPSVENGLAAELKEEADRVAIDIFAGNLRQLLLAAPLKGRRVLALDPGYRTGCKVVALDSQGQLLDDAVIYPAPPRNDTAGAFRTLQQMVSRHRLEVAAIGNGTASRETERFVKESKLFAPHTIYIVSENGASVYSASDVARQEFPDKDVTVRGAVSIGRRLIDPLAELVKIDPKSIGVGQYQHDVDQGKLKDSLDYTVASCVNAVGVDVNTASPQLLAYVSGIGPALAANIVAYRSANGDFRSRRELRKVPRLGDKAFELAAGFLRVAGGPEPLDNTGIHPESYALVREMARSVGASPADLAANEPLLARIDTAALAARGVGGLQTMNDIIAELRKPGRDPRTDSDNEAFVAGVDSFEQLTEGMTLPGIVSNITAFGAFINLGIKENGLLHISQLSTRRVAAVTDVLKLGQRVDVRILAIDRDRRRISLTLLPG